MTVTGHKPDRTGSEGRLGLRLLLASLAAGLVLIPFTLLLLLVESTWQPLEDLDQGVANALHDFAVERPWFTTLMQIWTNVFSPEAWRLIVAAAVIYLFWRGAPRLALWAATTLIVGGLLGLAIKIVVERARPLLPDPVAIAPGSSFPSGHALNATLGAGVMVLLLLPILRTRTAKLWAWLTAVVIAVGVAFTRVALGVHFVSDVVAGMIFGAAVLAATTAAFETWRRGEGRRPAVPHMDGVEPEARTEINPGEEGMSGDNVEGH